MDLPVRPEGKSDEQIVELASSLASTQIEMLDKILEIVKQEELAIGEFYSVISELNNLCALHIKVATELNLA